MSDLALIPKEALIQELSNRYDHLVITGMIVRKEDKAGKGYCTEVDYTRRWKGNNHMCMGLCSDMAWEIKKQQHCEETPLPEAPS